MKFLKVFFTTSLIFGFTISIFGILKFFSADIVFRQSENLLKNERLDQALKKANTAIKLNSNEPTYYQARAKAYIALTSTTQNIQQKQEFKNKALQDLQTSLALNPKNLVTIRNLIPLYYFLSLNDLNNTAADRSFENKNQIYDQFYFKTTKEYLKEVKNNAKNDIGIYILLAQYEKRLGLNSDFEQTKQKVKELRPDIVEWHLVFID